MIVIRHSVNINNIAPKTENHVNSSKNQNFTRIQIRLREKRRTLLARETEELRKSQQRFRFVSATDQKMA